MVMVMDASYIANTARLASYTTTHKHVKMNAFSITAMPALSRTDTRIQSMRFHVLGK